jgi:hypothetical protein
MHPVVRASIAIRVAGEVTEKLSQADTAQSLATSHSGMFIADGELETVASSPFTD